MRALFACAVYILPRLGVPRHPYVVAALRGGPVVILASVIAFGGCLVFTAALCRSTRRPDPDPNPEAAAMPVLEGMLS